MGLDSVELLYTVEKHFKIRISDREAEQIRTVEDFADCVAKYININSDSVCKSQYLFYMLKTYFADLYSFDKNKFLPSTLLDDIFPMDSRQERWNKLSDDLGLELPRLKKVDLGIKTQERFFTSLFSSGERVQIGEYNIRDFVNWVLALNYKQLIKLDRIFTKSEVTRIVIGIISETQGIDVEEIQPFHSISKDLGIS